MNRSFYLNELLNVKASIAQLENQMDEIENISEMPQSFLEQNNWYYQQCVRHIVAYRRLLYNLTQIVNEIPAEYSM